METKGSIVQQSDHSHAQLFTSIAIAICGGAALLLGLALIILLTYHERAYVFLCLGAAGLIGGIAGIIGTGPKLRVIPSYGAIGFGMMGMVIGLNYLIDRYGPGPNQSDAALVIAVSLLAILGGIAGALTAQKKNNVTAFYSVITLGLIASTGIVALTVGAIYLIVLEHAHTAYLLLAMGAACLLGGVICGILAQSKTSISALFKNFDQH